jgi:hypothetical protein
MRRKLDSDRAILLRAVLVTMTAVGLVARSAQSAA